MVLYAGLRRLLWPGMQKLAQTENCLKLNKMLLLRTLTPGFFPFNEEFGSLQRYALTVGSYLAYSDPTRTRAVLATNGMQ